MPLTILSDSDVKTLLHSLSRADILDIQQSLADALHYYSTSLESEGNGCCSSLQPQRTVLKKGGNTTLVMPASSNDGLGVKIVTLAEGKGKCLPGKEGGSVSETSSSAEQSLSSLSLSQKSSPSSPMPENLSSPPSNTSTSEATTCPRGALTLLSPSGLPRALINASEVTAFRTALASTMLFKKRSNVHDLTVFGAGKQAYWHIRLALLLRGSEIHHLNVINRSFERAQEMVRSLYNTDFNPLLHHEPEPLREKHPKTMILTPGHHEYGRMLKDILRSSSAIFCTTPSTSPLFDHTILTNPEGRRKGRYIAAIGSYKPHMIELHPSILQQAVKPEHGHMHFHKHAKTGGAVIVDSVEGALVEAGEIIQAGLKGEEVVEIGELVMLKRDAERRRAEASAHSSREGSVSSLDSAGVELGSSSGKSSKSSSSGSTTSKDDQVESGLKEWLERGNVIYKSVGLGLMDVVVGNELVRLAEKKGLGTTLDNF